MLGNKCPVSMCDGRTGRRVLGVFASLLCLALLALTLWDFLGVNLQDPGEPCYRGTWVAFAGAVLAAPPSLWLIFVADSPHLRTAAGYALLNWVSMLFVLLAECSDCTPPSSAFSLSEKHRGLLKRPAAPMAFIVVAAGYLLVADRLAALECSSLQRFSSRPVKAMTIAGSVLAMVTYIVYCTLEALEIEAPAFLAGPVFICGVLFVSATVLVVISLIRASSAANAAVITASPLMQPWARGVRRSLLLQVVAVILSFITNLPNFHARAPERVRPAYVAAAGVAQLLALLDMLSNDLLALIASGVLRNAAQSAARHAKLADERARRRKVARRSWNKSGGEPAWDAKVSELAEQGLSVSALLKFYKGELPKWMPSFDNELHTTADVAFGAIIPFCSEQKSCAAAVLMGQEAGTRPQKMVTHSWKGLFRDLVAGVLADAFEEGEYGLWSRLLAEQDFATIEKWVEQAGVGHKTYWICCFSVNQHRSTCHRESKSYATGQIFPACKCGLPKALNGTEPLLPDGRSIPCELNKFDDMIRLLAATGEFEQVTVVDAHFDVFTRAWCIAELAASNEIGLVQHLRIRSQAMLAEHEDELRCMKIQNMGAKRPEDKAAILASIEDHAAFDAMVQKMLFEDLLPRWSSLDYQERMLSAGRMLRWGSTLAWGQDDLDLGFSQASERCTWTP